MFHLSVISVHGVEKQCGKVSGKCPGISKC